MSDEVKNNTAPQGDELSDPLVSPETMKEDTRGAGLIRTLIGGALMGVANIIPGVSGGTMILALGLYEQFVEAVADVTRFRFRMRSVIFLALVVISAVVAIGACVYPIRYGLDNAHHIMYALFIGLTLGGVPVIYRAIKPMKAPSIIGAAAGFGAMIVIALVLKETNVPINPITYVVAGFIASAAMVLPGISGSYLLLIIGMYSPLTDKIKEFIGYAKDFDMGGLWTIGLEAIFPIGIGVVLGVAGLTNVLKALLHRFHDATMGVLMGLLLGSVVGIYPFSDLVEEGKVMATAPPYTVTNVVLVIVLIAVGFAATWFVSRLGGEEA